MSVIIQTRYFDTSPQRKQGGFPLVALRACTTPPWVLTLVLAFCHPATGAEKFDPEAYVKVVAPFIDEQTLIVAHADLSRVDLDAIRAVLESLPIPGGFDAEQKEEIKKELKKVESTTIQWLTAFRKAGGKEIYAIVSLTQFPGPFPLLILPVGGGADAAGLERLFPDKLFTPVPRPPHPIGVDLPWAKIKGWRTDNILFIGPEMAERHMKNFQPAQGPALAKGFAAAGDTFAQVLLLPPTHMGRIFNEVMPVLPPEIGGGSTRLVTEGVQWGALGLDLPPKMGFRLVFQSRDPLAAQALKDLKILAPIKPRVENDRVVLSQNHKEMADFVQPRIVEMWGKYLEGRYLDNLKKNMNHLVVANYHFAERNNGQLPATATYDKQGRPLLSWRVQILPFLGQNDLYHQFHLDEPWDSGNNRKLIEKMPSVFALPRSPLNALGKTVFLAPTGKRLAFEGNKGLRFPRDFVDGTANTILFVEADDAHAVIWTKPEDLAVDLNDPGKGLGHHFGPGTLVGMADGSPRFVNHKVNKATLKALFTRNGGEVVDW